MDFIEKTYQYIKSYYYIKCNKFQIELLLFNL